MSGAVEAEATGKQHPGVRHLTSGTLHARSTDRNPLRLHSARWASINQGRNAAMALQISC